MNLDAIRKTLYSIKNKNFYFVYNGLRGQNEMFNGKITRIYSRVFCVETDNRMIKCFSYSDFATKTLKIYDKRK